MPQIRQRPLNPVIAPGGTFPGDPQNQFNFNNVLRQWRPSHVFPLPAVVPVPGNEFAMPAEDRIRSYDGGQLLEHLPPEDLAFDSQPPPLVVVKQDSVLSELLSENPILLYEVLDGVLLSAIDPAGEDQEQELPWLKLRLHVPPDARLGSAASGIVGTLSSVAPGVAGVRGNARRYSRLRLG